jgi:hypothetical protein
MVCVHKQDARQRNRLSCIKSMCTASFFEVFICFSQHTFFESFNSSERSGCTKKHKCTTVQKNINVENKLEHCICKRIFWFLLKENLHSSINWLAYSEGQENLYHSKITRKHLTLINEAPVESFRRVAPS